MGEAILRTVLAVAAKSPAPERDRPPISAVDDAADRAFATLCPWHRDFTEFEHTWVSPQRRALARMWSNEPTHPATQVAWHADRRAVLCWTGTFGSAVPPDLAHDLTTGTRRDAYVADATGLFAFFAASDEGAAALTNVHRAASVYWAEDADFVYLGSSAALLNLVSTRATTPSYYLPGLTSMVCAGHPTTEESPFVGSHVLGAGEVARLRAGSLRRSQLPSTDAPADDPAAVAKLIADRLIAACAAEAAGAEQVTASVTGGKDSRLVVAAMHAAGVDFSTSTSGFPEHPDVRIGREVARLLGVRHENNVPGARPGHQAATSLSVDPPRRAWGVLRRCEGMTTPFHARVGREVPFRPGVPAFNGVGGELLRGGLARGWGRARAQTIITVMNRWLMPDPYILREDVRREYEAATNVWRERARTAPMQALADYHRLYRVGRWSAAARNNPGMERAAVSVLMDNAMIRVVAQLPVSELHDERVVARVLGHLNPKLQRFVFCNERWDFEQTGPAGLLPAEQWADRAPLPLVAQRRSGFSWRLSYGPHLSAYFRRTMLADRSHPLFDIVDWDAANTLLAADSERAKLVWNMYSVYYLLGNEWLRPTPPDPEPVSVPLPTA